MSANLVPCKHLDYDGDYTDCTVETAAPHYPHVRFWRRGPLWTGSGEPVRVQFCGAGRGRINSVLACYQPGEMPCYEPALVRGAEGDTAESAPPVSDGATPSSPATREDGQVRS